MELLHLNETSNLLTANATVADPGGLHGRPLYYIKRQLSGLDATITITADSRTITHTPDKPLTLLGGLRAGFVQGTELTITAKGPDAERALNIVKAFIEAGPEGYFAAWLRH